MVLTFTQMFRKAEETLRQRREHEQALREQALEAETSEDDLIRYLLEDGE